MPSHIAGVGFPREVKLVVLPPQTDSTDDGSAKAKRGKEKFSVRLGM